MILRKRQALDQEISIDGITKDKSFERIITDIFYGVVVAILCYVGNLYVIPLFRWIEVDRSMIMLNRIASGLIVIVGIIASVVILDRVTLLIIKIIKGIKK